ncbi:hypothetical protein J6590_064446 [Homalodisca vitripennis]|nr:hypothetical protein J6590_064446 [Homalodisca vitripennis]
MLCVCGEHASEGVGLRVTAISSKDYEQTMYSYCFKRGHCRRATVCAAGLPSQQHKIKANNLTDHCIASDPESRCAAPEHPLSCPEITSISLSFKVCY